jgi:outer membrane protein TolC
MKRASSRIALVGVVLLAAGCAAAPPAPAPFDAAANAQAWSARRMDDPALRAFVARSGAQTDGDDWTPERIGLAALWFDPALAAARAIAQRTAADAKLASERANPMLTLTPEKIYHAAQAGEVSPWTITLSLALQLLHPGEKAAKRGIENGEIRAADWELADAVWKTRARALAASRGAVFAERAVALSAQAAAADADWQASAQRRLAAGEGDRTELFVARDAAVRAASAEQTRRVAAVDAQQALAAAIGVPAAALQAVHPVWPQLDEPPAPDSLDARSLGEAAAVNRLDLRALLARYDVAEAQLRQAAGTRFPQLGVAPGYIYDRGDRKYVFGVDVEVPLFHGADARIVAAAAARDEAAAKVRARQAEIVGGLDRVRSGYAQRHRAWQAALAVRAAAAAAVRQADAALRVGSGDRPSLLQAQARQAEADLAVLDACAAAWDGLAAIEDAVQRPLFPPSHFDPSAFVANAHADASASHADVR